MVGAGLVDFLLGIAVCMRDANLGCFGNNTYMYAYIVCIFCEYFIYSMYEQKEIEKVQDNHLRIK